MRCTSLNTGLLQTRLHLVSGIVVVLMCPEQPWCSMCICDGCGSITALPQIHMKTRHEGARLKCLLYGSSVVAYVEQHQDIFTGAGVP